MSETTPLGNMNETTQLASKRNNSTRQQERNNSTRQYCDVAVNFLPRSCESASFVGMVTTRAMTPASLKILRGLLVLDIVHQPSTPGEIPFRPRTGRISKLKTSISVIPED
ncbi:hypothetical protein TNCV_4806861 [Trichonephila clavipes]|nr:hypothetical protein TNCV_4806861 [Trichonephila clavipes]